MKKIYFSLFLICIAIAAYAQLTIDDFESGNKGWSAVSNMGYVDVRDNEYKTGLNLTEHVMFMQHAQGDDNWAGAILNNVQQSDYKYLHAHMYRNNTGIPNLKVSDDPAKDIEPLNTIVANQWQDVVFDISDYETSGTEFVMLMVDRNEVSELVWVLVDNIILSNDATPRTEVMGGNTEEEEEEQVTDADGYKLVWQDNFNASSFDLDLWNIETNGDGGGNNELQYYCDRGVSVSNGNLALTATKENYEGKKCTSGRVTTQDKVYFTYGKVQARIKMPKTANGLWPAFWMMGNDISSVSWPRCGETDIVEMGHQSAFSAGKQDRFFNGAMHWGQAWNATGDYAQDFTATTGLQDDYHIWTCIWTPDKVSMYLDDSTSPYFSMGITKSDDTSAPGYYFHKPNFILLNLAVGGHFPGIYDINGITALASGSQSMLIDWVRIWQRGDQGETFYSAKKTDTSTDNEEQTQDALMNINSNIQSTKIFENGHIYIIRNGVKYDVLGNKLANF